MTDDTYFPEDSVTHSSKRNNLVPDNIVSFEVV